MNYIIAILITTFLRDKLLYKTIQTIVDNRSTNCIILIADQGYNNSEKNITIDYLKSQIPLEYYKLSFDCGLGIAKNFLVQKASEMQIPYCLIMPDSIQFTEVYNFEQLFNILDNNNLINFGLIPLKNIFIAKTNTLLNLWDEEMKLHEYELAHTEYLKRNYKIIYNTNYIFKKINSRCSDEYYSYSKRIKEYKKLSEQKLKEQKKCFNYKNLQPLWAEENRSKNAYR